MKRIFFSIVAALFTMTAGATDLWEGSQAVTWDNTVQIDASLFADMKVGQKLVFEFTVQAEDVIELHSNFSKLTGTRYHRLYTDNTSFEVFSTKAMVDSLKAYGLEICGSQFTLTKVWYGDGKENVSDNTFWTGFFWMDSWSTMELWKESLPQSLEGYKAVRFLSEANRTDYIINVMSSWDAADRIAKYNPSEKDNNLTITPEYAELDLTQLTKEQKALFYKSDRLMIQCNKENGEAFNFTAIEFIPEEATGIQELGNLGTQELGNSAAYNLAGQRVSAEAKGLVIENGRKVIK